MDKRELIQLARRACRCRGHYRKAVCAYIPEIVDRANLERGELSEMRDDFELEKRLLNGANDWQHYSAGACSLVSNHEIALRLFPAHDAERIMRRELRRSDCALIERQGSALQHAAICLRYAFRALRILDNGI